MKIFKKIKTIVFSKGYIGDIIDLFYGSTCIYIEYFAGLVGFIGMLYLYELFATKHTSIILTRNTKEMILSGDLNKAVLVLIIIINVLKIIRLIFGKTLKENYKIIYGFVIGSASLVSFINEVPIPTFDDTLLVVVSFTILKFVLITITKVFKISTIHFGNYIAIECPPLGVAVKKSISDKDVETKEE